MSRTSRLGWVSLVFVWAVLACSEDAPTPGDGGASTPPPPPCADAAPPGSSGTFFPCDVDAILAAKCRRCHNSEAVVNACNADKTCVAGPFPLLVWSDTRHDIGDGTRPIDHIASVVSSGFMPFSAPDITPPVEKLTEAEKKVLIQWAQACAPPGPTACGDAAQ